MNQITLTQMPTMAELEVRFRNILTESLRTILQEVILKKDENLLTRKEVAAKLGISLPTVHAWTKKGILTAHCLGRKKFYKQSEILNPSQKKGLSHGR